MENYIPDGIVDGGKPSLAFLQGFFCPLAFSDVPADHQGRFASVVRQRLRSDLHVNDATVPQRVARLAGLLKFRS
jgi:hypothetical protein